MRRMFLTVGVAAMALVGATACGDDGTPGASASADTVAAATRDACTQATALSASAATEFNAKMDEFIKAALAQDATKSEQLETEIRAKVTEWEAKLNDLAAKDIKPEVKTALSQAAETLKKHNDPSDNASVNEVKAAYVAIATKISTACA